MNTTGAIIRSIRTSKGLSQEYIANELGLQQAAYSNIENNKTDVTISRLREIARHLEVNVYDLINIDNEVFAHQPSNNYQLLGKGYEVSVTIKLNDPAKESELLKIVGLK